MSHHKKHEHSAFQLLKTRRFAPFFWTQFTGALNDNIYKTALMLIIAFQSQSLSGGETGIMMNLAAGVFILPFFLFSPLAGQLADKYEKSSLIRGVKILEIPIMGCAAGSLILGADPLFLVLILFLMGTQSAFFGPVKYSIIPQHLKESEIVGGNALVEMGTFLAILLGTIAGGVLVRHGSYWVACAVLVMACAGWLFSRRIPSAGAADPDLRIRWNLVAQSLKILGHARRDRVVFLAILGISWFWFLGASYLTQVPGYARDVLGAGESVTTLLLAMFSIGIGVGSILCERLSGKRVEYGLVPIGSAGLSIFGLDLAFAGVSGAQGSLLGVMAFLKAPGSLRVLVDLTMIGLFGGFYIVPLFAIVQTRSEERVRSRILAANNILNALFMVAASLMGGVLLGVMGISIPFFFGILSGLNLLVAVYVFTRVPEFAMRCIIWLVTHLFYRIRHRDLDLIPKDGPAVIVCNHVSYMDALIIAGLCRRPARFVMARGIYRLPVLNFIFRTGRAIPIVSALKDPEGCRKALDKVSEELRAGNIVCIFPEGRLTTDGEIGDFKKGILRIVERDPVPVVPAALRGLWGSFFSHCRGKALTTLPRRFFSKIEFHVGHPVPPEYVSVDGLKQAVSSLRGNAA